MRKDYYMEELYPYFKGKNSNLGEKKLKRI